MESLIKKLIKEVFEVEDKPLSQKEIRLFKYLNTNKHQYGTQDKMLGLIKTMMPFIGRPESDARFYYEIYTANYRPDGDYENIDKTTFKDYRGFKQRRTPNNNAYEYSGGKIPFKGSNLEGYWDVNRNGDWFYVVTSYGWYPIFLFIKDQWYRVSNSYSSSTAKQISHANPVRWNSGLKANVISVTPDEIKKIRDGEEMGNIETKRVENFIQKFAKPLIGGKKMISIGWYDDRKKVNYTITDIKQENGKIKFYITINKAGKVVDNKMVIDPDGYPVPSPFSEDIEKGVINRIISENKDYLSYDNTDFIFIHSK